MRAREPSDAGERQDLRENPNEKAPNCYWAQDDIGGDSMWETTCGHAFEFNDGGPCANGFKFCGYCGKPLVETLTSEDAGYDDDYRDTWCSDFAGHSAQHEFCSHHQAAWCRTCEGKVCPECVEDPHCPDCGVALPQEDHDWDCLYAE